MTAQRISAVAAEDYEDQLLRKLNDARELVRDFNDLRIEFEKTKPSESVIFRLQQFADKLRDVHQEAKDAYGDF